MIWGRFGWIEPAAQKSDENLLNNHAENLVAGA